MVSLFSFPQIKGERTPFIGKGRPHFLVSFQCGIASHKGKKKLKPQNVGPTPISLVIFQCGIVSHKRKKILSLKIWGLHFDNTLIKGYLGSLSTYMNIRAYIYAQ